MGLSTFLRFDSFDAERSVTSFFVQPKVLIVTRVLGLIYLVAVLAGALATTSSLKYFIQFFTNIGWVALTLYYLWALILSVQYYRLSEFERTQWAKKGNRVIQIIFWIVYSSQAVYHMLIPLIFWALMRKYQRPHTGVYEWATVSEHTTNVVFMALEMTLTRMTMDVRHIVFTLGFVLLYLLMAFVDHWINGTWVYSALDYETMGWTKVGLFYVVVAVGMTVVYLILWKLHQIKERRGVQRQQRQLQARLESDIESVASQEPSKLEKLESK
ncbi:hypothetical protein BGZ52_008314 [Haplosporangium bisporale]|uniref:Uncharacterized protein n=1 Tax=Podila verticillata NRRL 6337 TaxID=1069443 RepID=A0A086TMG1_9FUNG|nr:hypothetical protein BGZ52_008314 [Haplosporangium bisporale]KAI9239382.1 MAG: hypothetical protein BYD32DRAFT_231334 [Podila humilis]KFH63138.1 hypothetical protein MVEG_11175 [Podila verticillata NRRL 6337]